MMKKKCALLICVVMSLVCIRCSSAIAGTTYGIWTIKRYVDSFQQETTEKYVVNDYSIAGTFRDTASYDERAWLFVVMDPDCTRLKLYKYSVAWGMVDDSWAEEYDVGLRASNGYEEWFTGNREGYSEYVYINDADRFDNFLINYSKVIMRVRSKKFNDSFLFSFNTSGLKKAKEKIFTTPQIDITFNMDEAKPGVPLTASYQITKGRPSTRGIHYWWYLYDGEDFDFVEEGDLNTSSGTLSYTPTKGHALLLDISVFDAAKLHNYSDNIIPMEYTWISLPSGITEIKKETFANVGRVANIWITDNIENIADDAFEGFEYVFFWGHSECAKKYAEKHSDKCYYRGDE